MAEHVHALPSGYHFEEYEIVRVLGSGGFGITYLAYDDNLDKAVAIKEYLPHDLAVRHASTVVPKSTSDEDDFEWGLERFLAEAKTLARFKHHNIIQVHRFFRAHGTAYIVMEYAEGETLNKQLVKHGTYKEDELRDVLLPIIDGLMKVHAADYLHRDIKPGNIIIRDDGSPVLIDFGAARQAIGAKSRSVTSIISPGYAPIEQYAAKGNQGPWTDIYALGAVGYKCITGETPVDAAERVLEDSLRPLVEIMPRGFSDEFLKAIDAALQVNVKDRPSSLRAWKRQLMGQSDLLGRRSRRRGKKKPGRKAAAGPRWGVIAAALAVIVVGTSGFVYWIKSGDTTPPGPAPTTSSGPEVAPIEKKEEEEEPGPGPSEDVIRRVQEALNKLGYVVAVSGVLDTRTEAAIREFERRSSLLETGVPDQILLDALERAIATRDRDERDWQAARAADTIDAYEEYRRNYPNGIYAGQAGTRIAELRQIELIRDIQRELVRLGWLQGSVDGVLGPNTVSAIEDFQRSVRIAVDGRPTQSLLQRLKSAQLRAHVVAQDGTGNYRTIAAAINAVPAGSRIQIRPGTYNESLEINKTVHLEGVGSRDRIILEATNNRALTISGGSGSVKNLTARYVGTTQTWYTIYIDGGNWTIENNDLSNKSDVAALAVVSGDPTVRGNLIHDFNKEGIIVKGTAKGRFINNTIYNGGSSMILLQENADPYFSGNRLYGAVTAIEVANDAKGRFENNDIAARIKVLDQAAPTFRSNDIHDIDGNAINIKGTGGGLYEDNEIYNAGVRDKRFPSVWVSKDARAEFYRNRLYGTGWPSLYLESPTKSVATGNDVRS